MFRKITSILAVLALSATSILAQTHQKCASADLLQAAIKADPSILAKQADLEAKTKAFIKSRTLAKTTGTVYTIPVVFHIIHNGEAIGTGSNVSDSQVNFQLKRMNEDFRKTNADTLMPSHAFYPLQADCEIEFCLAKRDAAGNATTGINRYNKSGASWTINQIDTFIKPSTIWDRNKYMNIWCVNLIDPASPGVDGYATFPAGSNDTTDGLVVASFAFGWAAGSGDKSIVASHEIGHYLNLIHIWGDGTCGNDFVSDTPPAEMSNSGCPTFPHNVTGPCMPGANGEMFMNYMDYSDAACTVMFTPGQKLRMQAVLTSYRVSLTTSDGCTAPVGIKEIAAAQNFNIYPNPNNGTFSIEAINNSNTKTAISLYNQLGAKVQQYKDVQNFPFKIDMSAMPEGLYFIKLDNGNEIITKKILISK
ncbi:MAG: T9SS type A sorting domain-containing protein [Chitinophagaceae bacterium]|nr:T9SS type A sorting domain-containing protein [Chitinophagaceae bacterium]